MAGNVWEWVADFYGETYYNHSPASNPTGPEDGTLRVLRGGSWFDEWGSIRTSARNPVIPTLSSNTTGFRCARSYP